MRHLRIDDSSNVSAVTFSEAGLEIEFKSGALYTYRNVQAHQFGELAAAQSVGKYIQQFTRNPTSYPVRKIREARSDADEQADALPTKLEESVFRQALTRIAELKPMPEGSSTIPQSSLAVAFATCQRIARQALGRE